MTIAHPDPADGLRPQEANFASRLVHAAQRFVATSGEGSIVAWALGGFVVVWMLYDTVSLLTVDVRCEAGGCSVLQLQPIPIANYMNERSQMVVAPCSTS